MDNYILMNDMVQAHEERMMHLKRYYPFFRLMVQRTVSVQRRRV
ncbi:MAG: hypothetical protein ACLR1V_12145 [Coprococcus sp.]